MTDPQTVSLLCDIVLIVILFISLGAGWRHGAAKIVLRVLGGVIAILLAYFFYEKLADALCQAGWQEKIASRLNLKLLLGLDTGEAAQAQQNVTSEQAIALIEAMNLPESLKQALITHNTADLYEAMGVTSFLDYVSLYLARVILNGLSFLLIYFVSALLLRFLASHMEVVNKIPVLGFVNRVIGAAGGLFLGYVALMVVLCILTLLAAGSAGTLAKVLSAVQQSKVGAYLLSHNPLLDWIMSLKG